MPPAAKTQQRPAWTAREAAEGEVAGQARPRVAPSHDGAGETKHAEDWGGGGSLCPVAASTLAVASGWTHRTSPLGTLGTGCTGALCLIPHNCA